jgi:dTDP-4-dehydrorhamnose 3,5-epimerase
MIDSVMCRKLNPIHDERGYLMEILRNDDPEFTIFGQTYITTSYNGVVKAWHLHNEQVDRICCVKGMIKLVTIKEMSDNKYDVSELFIGEKNPCLVTIPPGIYHGWKAYDGDAIVMNITDIPYNREKPDEYRKSVAYFDSLYNWGRVDK